MGHGTFTRWLRPSLTIGRALVTRAFAYVTEGVESAIESPFANHKRYRVRRD